MGWGSVTAAVSTSSGAVTATQLYSPYGSVRYSSGTLPTSYGFTGQRADAATGLDYYNARYYDPVAGQFTSADTTLAGGLNRYAYVGGNPETRTDPSGHVYAQRTTPYYQDFGASVYHLISQDSGQATNGMSSALFIAYYDTDAYRAALGYSTSQGVLVMPHVGEDANTYIESINATHGSYWNSSSDAMLELVRLKALSHDFVVMNTGTRSGDLNLFNADTQPLLAATASEGPLSAPLASEGEGDCGLSFAATTPVATPSGEQAIAHLKVGQQVEAYDPTTGKTAPQTIVRVFLNHDSDRLDVTLATRQPATSAASAASRSVATQSSLTRAGHGRHLANIAPTTITTATAAIIHEEVIHTTASHPWLSVDHGWLRAGTLHIGEPVRLLDGGTATVVALHALPGVGPMWDLSLDATHTFAVGDAQAVVHNCLPTESDVPDPKPQYKADGKPNRDPGAWINVEGPDGSVETYPAGPQVGVHAEDNAQAAVPGGRMSRAMGWRRVNAELIWKEIPVCQACQAKYPSNLFPPGVQAQPGGAWEP